MKTRHAARSYAGFTEMDTVRQESDRALLAVR
jgi:hypothetical protein